MRRKANINKKQPFSILVFVDMSISPPLRPRNHQIHDRNPQTGSDQRQHAYQGKSAEPVEGGHASASTSRARRRRQGIGGALGWSFAPAEPKHERRDRQAERHPQDDDDGGAGPPREERAGGLLDDAESVYHSFNPAKMGRGLNIAFGPRLCCVFARCLCTAATRLFGSPLSRSLSTMSATG